MAKWLRYNPDAERFSREWWLSSLRSALWVALVTVLIWMYADMELARDRSYTATVQLQAGPDLAMLSDDQVELKFVLEGDSLSLETFDRQLPRLTYDVTPYGPGDTAISSRDVLLRAAGVTKAGLKLVSVTPSTISVTLDKMTTQEVPVQFRHTGAEIRNAVVDPARMSIRVAQSRWEHILKQTSTPALQTQSVSLQNVDPNRPLTVEVDPYITGVRVRPQQQTVRVTVEVTQITATRTITVPVRIVCPVAWGADDTWQNYQLERQQPLEWRKQITVQGPEEAVDALRPEQVDAYVELTENDKNPTESWLAGDVIVRFPARSKLEPVGPAPTVSYRLVRRAPAGG